MKIQRIAQVAVLAAAVAAIAPAMAQNIAVVNGKGVPVARFEAMKAQVAKQGQQITPEIEGKIKEQLVKMEIFAQEAERRGVAQSKEYREQMEFVRQNVLIQLMFADFEKKNGASEADARPSTTSSRPPMARASTARATSWSRRKKKPRPWWPSSRPVPSSKSWPRRLRRTQVRLKTVATWTGRRRATTCPSSRKP